VKFVKGEFNVQDIMA